VCAGALSLVNENGGRSSTPPGRALYRATGFVGTSYLSFALPRSVYLRCRRALEAKASDPIGVLQREFLVAELDTVFPAVSQMYSLTPVSGAAPELLVQSQSECHLSPRDVLFVQRDVFAQVRFMRGR
jgi:hypothetical protein